MSFEDGVADSFLGVENEYSDGPRSRWGMIELWLGVSVYFVGLLQLTVLWIINNNMLCACFNILFTCGGTTYFDVIYNIWLVLLRK